MALNERKSNSTSSNVINATSNNKKIKDANPQLKNTESIDKQNHCITFLKGKV